MAKPYKMEWQRIENGKALGDKSDYIYVCQKFHQIFSVKEQNTVMLSEDCDKTCK